MDDLQAGVYRHYKGPLYLVLGLAHDANAEDLYRMGMSGIDYVPLVDRTVVVYIGLQLDDAHTGPRLAVRTYSDFFANICTRKEHSHYGKPVPWDEQTVCNSVQRFTYIGPTWEGQQ